VALSESALNELAAEYRRIMVEADKLRREAETIAAFLKQYNRLPPEAGPSIRLGQGTTRVELGEAPSGLRSTIISILHAADRGYRPSEMTNALTARGFQDSGEPSTPLSIRVGSELARLYRDEKITKDRDGRYVSLRKASGLVGSAAEMNGQG